MEKRNFYRTPVHGGLSTDLLLEGHPYSAARVTDIGLRGCCVQLPTTSAAHLKDHAPIDNLQLSGVRDDLYTLKARIAWYDLPKAGQDAWIRTGIEFLDTPDACAREIRELVAEGMSYWDH